MPAILQVVISKGPKDGEDGFSIRFAELFSEDVHVLEKKGIRLISEQLADMIRSIEGMNEL